MDVDFEDDAGEVVKGPELVSATVGVTPGAGPERWTWRERVAVGVAVCVGTAVCWALTCLAVVVGTALGNGIPMSRTVSAAFASGVQTGLSQGRSECPCKNRANSSGRIALRPTPEAANADNKGGEPVPELTKALGRDTVPVGPAIGQTPTPLDPSHVFRE